VNDPKTRKRLTWLAVIAGAMLVALLFISTFAPSGPSAAESPVLRPAQTASLTRDPAEADQPAPAADSSTGFSLGGGELISLAWRLALVIVIIAASIVGLRWWGKKASGPRSTTGFLRVIDTLAISNGRTIHLVALGERVIAVGATAQQLTLLNELTAEEAVHVLAQSANTSEQPLSQFAAELFQSIRRNSRGGTSHHSPATIGLERD
jgi:flagellar biogenesis protein FliO